MSTSPDEYVLGFDRFEQRRLAMQDRLFRRFTQSLIDDAGIADGMTVLDVGSGVGHVSQLIADRVGPRGKVLAVERSPAYSQTAQELATARGYRNIEVLEGDLLEDVPERSFDAVVGRFVLEWLPDPTEAVSRLARRLRPGGVMAFQDYDHPLTEGQYSHPTAPLFDRVLVACIDALCRNGLHRRMGSELRHTFIDAGMPAPELRVDVSMGGGPDYAGYGWLAAGAYSLRDALADTAVADLVRDPEILEARLREDVMASDSVVRLAPIVGAWARKP